MSGAIKLSNSIIQLVTQIDKFQEATSKTSPSNVTKDNPYRPLLESIRSCLLNFDDEKKEMIIYTVNDQLQSIRDDDKELIAVLERVLEVVEHYKFNGTILFSPQKPSSSLKKDIDSNFRAKKHLSFESDKYK